MDSFMLPSTHVHLGADGAADVLDSAGLWSRAPADLEEALPNWLVAGFPVAVNESPGAAELHPNGDELLCVVAGALDVHLDDPADQRVVALRAGEACLVPRGTWHRLRGREAGDLIAITYGRGTKHR